MIPKNFDTWKLCIEKDCNINLTKDYCNERLAKLQNKELKETIEFERLYGKKHLENIISWFKIVLSQF